jgi:hypothetical protein
MRSTETWVKRGHTPLERNVWFFRDSQELGSGVCEEWTPQDQMVTSILSWFTSATSLKWYVSFDRALFLSVNTERWEGGNY